MAAHREEVFFESRSVLRSWLAQNSNQANGIWAVFYKKSTGISDLSWAAIVEECLCCGWIDSLPGKVDDHKTKIYISPRKQNSGWSRRNKKLIVELEKLGRMTDAGRNAIEMAVSSGSWARFDLAENLILSEDVVAMFEKDKKFAVNWMKLTDSRKRQFLQQIYDAKKEETRKRRILQIKKVIQK